MINVCEEHSRTVVAFEGRGRCPLCQAECEKDNLGSEVDSLKLEVSDLKSEVRLLESDKEDLRYENFRLEA